MVERYLIKKSLMKPLQLFYDLKRIKSFDMDSCDTNTAALIKELKNSFAGNEQLIVVQKPEKTKPAKPTSKGPQTMISTSQTSVSTSAKPQNSDKEPKPFHFKEVCCCNHDKKSGKQGPCLRKSQALDSTICQSETANEQIAQHVAKSQDPRQILWKHIILKVKHRNKMVDGQIKNVVQAMNLDSGEKVALIADPKLIIEQDIPGLERLLQDHVELAPADVSIYIQIEEKALRKRARAARK